MEQDIISKTFALPGRYIGETVLEMNYVQAGSFLMGNPRHKQAKIVIPYNFWLAKTPVTQAQWIDVMSGLIPKNRLLNDPDPLDFYPGSSLKMRGLDYPVYNVSWQEACLFTEKLNTLHIAPSGYYFELPTEAQWEYACSTGQITDSRVNDNAWIRTNSQNKIHPVAKKAANKYGLCDMLGNVREWCLDAGSDDLHFTGEIDPCNYGDETSRYHIQKGGNYQDSEVDCMPYSRSFNDDICGFRPALVPLPAPRIKTVKVSPGVCRMGSEEAEKGHDDDEKPYVAVVLQEFRIGKYPVTQKEFAKIMHRCSGKYKPDYPMVNVTWYEAKEFCNRLNRIGYAPQGYEYDLPSEDQWEYACKNEAGTMLDLNRQCWYEANSQHTVHPVGTKQPNAVGIYDMLGNVYEWCDSWYIKDDTSHEASVFTPRYKVLRGGSFSSTEIACRPSARNYEEPTKAKDNIGFRIVLVKQQGKEILHCKDMKDGLDKLLFFLNNKRSMKNGKKNEKRTERHDRETPGQLADNVAGRKDGNRLPKIRSSSGKQ